MDMENKTMAITAEQEQIMLDAIAAEKTIVLVELTDAQQVALAKMNKDTEISSIGRSVIASRIKGVMMASPSQSHSILCCIQQFNLLSSYLPAATWAGC